MKTRIQTASVKHPLQTALKLFLLAAILAALLLSGLKPTQAGNGSLPANSAITDTPVPYLFKDLVSGSEGSSPSQLSVVNDLLFFRADSLLWKSDGTQEGTIPSADFSFWSLYDPTLMGEVNGSQIVFALPGEYESYYRLWKTDGTSGGTAEIHNFLFQFSNVGSLSGFRLVDGILYFFLREGGLDYLQLWRSDGTHDGTQMVKRISVSSGLPRVQELEVLNNQLYFLIQDVDELWKTDGSEDGTVLVTCFQEYTEEMVSFDGKLFISADNGEDAGWELWVSDGTSEGTSLFKDFYPGNEGSDPYFVGMMGDHLFLAARNATVGKELWVTNGTPEGTTLVKDINPGSMGSYPEKGAVLGSNLIFSATDENFDYWLWRSDGTESGTALVTSGYPFESSNFYPANNVLFFHGYHPDSGYELWQTDGSADGTFLVADIYTGTPSSQPSGFMEYDGKLFFRADDGSHGRELWALDLPEDDFSLYLPLIQK